MRPKESNINENELTRILPSYLLEEVEIDENEKRKNFQNQLIFQHSEKNVIPKNVTFQYLFIK